MSAINAASATSQVRWLGFLTLQFALIGSGVAWAAARVMHDRIERALPPLRSEPLKVSPRYDVPLVVSDDQLRRVLGRLAPRNEGSKTKINHVDHALRFWGADAKFGDKRFISGEGMRKLLTDHRVFAHLYGEKAQPLLINRDEGVRVRVQAGSQSSSHVDHTMTGLAEVGTPPSYPIVTPEGIRTYGDMVNQALRDFSLNQIEYEWSAMTFALMLPPVRDWFSSEGQHITFDRLAERLMREDVPHGVCFANHRLFTLAAMLQIDEQQPILSPERRREALDYLRGITERLVRTQSPEGYWDGDWPRPKKKNEAERTSGDQTADRILATGHALEWWAIAPEEVLPPRNVIVAAGQWLVRTIDELSDAQIASYYTFLSHAGRSLALWRKHSPMEVAFILPPAEDKTTDAAKTDNAAQDSKPADSKPMDAKAAAESPSSSQ